MENVFDPELIRIYVGTDRSQMIGLKILEYSIAKHTSRPFKVYPLLLNLPVPKNKTNVQRTGFSFSRFAIPKLAGFQGKAIYMDADMQVFKDITELWDIPFDGAKMLIQEDIPEFHKNTSPNRLKRTRTKQCSVSLLDCRALDWEPEEIISGLDDKYDYKQLMDDICILNENELGYKIPFKWNSLEYWDKSTCNLHYTDMNTQPWVSPKNTFGYLWLNQVKEMLASGNLNWSVLEREVDLGFARPSILTELKIDTDLSIPDNKRTSMLQRIDRKAGYVMHKDVYKETRRRQWAEKEYLLREKGRQVESWLKKLFRLNN